MNALPFIIAPLPIAAQLEMFGAIMSVWALYTGQSVWSAAFSVSDLESNRLAGIKGLNRSNLCTRPQVTRPAEVRSSAGIMIGRLSPPPGKSHGSHSAGAPRTPVVDGVAGGRGLKSQPQRIPGIGTVIIRAVRGRGRPEVGARWEPDAPATCNPAFRTRCPELEEPILHVFN